MRKLLIDLIRDPATNGRLELAAFETTASNDGTTKVIEGILFNSATQKAYPVEKSVPIMMADAFSVEFLQRHRSSIAEHPILSTFSFTAEKRENWSFSREWDEHFETEDLRTWGFTVQERIEQFCLETQSSREWLKGKLVMDAGCGNGALSEKITDLGAHVIGLDFSSSVFTAENNRNSDDVHYLQGDLQTLPLATGSFDLITSIGVLHHTPNTLLTFQSLAKLVKPGGKFYFWLYRKPEGFLGRYIKVPIYDTLRWIISRLSPSLQDFLVKLYARLVRVSHSLRGKENPIPLEEYVVAAYDDLTCRWRHYHTPLEVSRWLFDNGFGAATLTHWDNPYGFGVVATKEKQGVTPGIHYGEGEKLWDENRSFLGKLHID